MATKSPPQPPKGSKQNIQKLHKSIGFSKGYNAVLFTIFIGALFGFCLARLEFLSFDKVFCDPNGKPGASAAPGECFWYTRYSRNKIGLIMHLATILPASMLACFQFVPIIRHKAIRYHRAAGYIIILLLLPSQAGVLMIANHAFGGDMSIRLWIGTLVIATTTAIGLAYYNIKRLQIDQHRAWMIRAWAWFASIITLRLIVFIAAQVSAKWGGEAISYMTYSCDEVLFMLKNNASALYAAYPACRPENIDLFTNFGQVVVQANAGIKSAPNQAAALDAFFGGSAWLAFTLHVLAVELYLHLTPEETARLKQISHERQLKAGLKEASAAEA